MRIAVIALTVMLLLGIAGPVPLHAQEWSAAQKEIWRVEEETVAYIEKGDVEKIMSYIHQDYRGSGHGSPVPIDKTMFRKQAEQLVKTYPVRTLYLQPTAIQVFGNTAIVHYIATVTVKSVDGNEVTSQSAYTDVFVKQGEKWLIVADNGNELKR